MQARRDGKSKTAHFFWRWSERVQAATRAARRRGLVRTVSAVLVCVAVQCDRCHAMVEPDVAVFGADGQWRCRDRAACGTRRESNRGAV